MKIKTVEDYLNRLSNEKKAVVQKIMTAVKSNLPKGFVEELNDRMIGYLVPASIYNSDTNPELCLPFIYISCQRSHYAFYHMGVFADLELFNSFKKRYEEEFNRKLEIGDCSMRFKKEEHIPFKMIGELCKEMTCEEWVAFYKLQTEKLKK